ncbi:hypothetical protein [Nocardia sp. alder85J]|uniref:hypothetical protein n=1 Tax=Nocardia sp. alder85J TaxID=2862949 RepID=UPI001CD2C515|nr:hypothetical protein [Nocardia sp. alder85J]MCX4095431.1 hypothetical protein [Nocardia sp. alder85J]
MSIESRDRPEPRLPQDTPDATEPLPLATDAALLRATDFPAESNPTGPAEGRPADPGENAGIEPAENHPAGPAGDGSADLTHSRTTSHTERTPLSTRDTRTERVPEPTDAERLWEIDPPPARSADSAAATPDSAAELPLPTDTTAELPDPDTDTDTSIELRDTSTDTPSAELPAPATDITGESRDPSTGTTAAEPPDLATDTERRDHPGDTTARMRDPGTDAVSEPRESAADTPLPVDTAADLREAAVDAVVARYGIDGPEGRAAVERVHEVVSEYHAPLITEGAVRILDHARARVAADPDTRVLFVGRDGHSLALAARELDPVFFQRYCTEATISRQLADTSLHDLEQHAGRAFPEVAEFRVPREQVDPADVPGTRAQLTTYLDDRGVPVAIPGSRILVADTSYRGSVQEMLAAQYEDVTFEGSYLFHAASPHDPHPGSKTGQLLHISADGTVRADSAATTFATKDAVLAIEHMLRGPLSKAVRFRDGLPEQELRAPTDGLDPAALAPEYRDEPVRLAALDAAQLAVAHHARGVAAQRADGLPWRAELAAAADRSIEQVRSWSERDDTVDPALRVVLDSFVRRSSGPPSSEQSDITELQRRTGLSGGVDHG